MTSAKTPPFVPLEFSKALQDSKRYAADTARSVLREWVGSHWRALSSNEADSLTIAWLRKRWQSSYPEKITPRNADAALTLALRVLDELPEPRPDDPLVIPCTNGAVHVDAAGVATLEPHDQKIPVRYALNCDYASGAPCPRFNAFLAQVLPDGAIRNRVQEYVGYTLLGDTRFQRAQLWLGTGANGKGVLANIMQALHQQVAAVRLDAMGGVRARAAHRGAAPIL